METIFKMLKFIHDVEVKVKKKLVNSEKLRMSVLNLIIAANSVEGFRGKSFTDQEAIDAIVEFSANNGAESKIHLFFVYLVGLVALLLNIKWGFLILIVTLSVGFFVALVYILYQVLYILAIIRR